MDEETALPIGAVEGRPGVTVVSQDNFQDYVTQQLGPAEGVVLEEENEDPEVAAKKELEELTQKQAAENGPKEGDLDGNKVFFKGKWTAKNDFTYRLHVKTEATEKAAQEKIEAAAAEAKAAREALEATAKERDELKAKYEPPKSNERKAQPLPSSYNSVEEFSAALIEWTREDDRITREEKTTAERAEKESAEVMSKWAERRKAIQEEIPDYETTINASDVKLSPQATDAVLKAENGHKILYHFAKNPEEAKALGQLSVRDMLLEVGRLNGALGSKPEPKPEPKPKPVEISKAPPPITPLKSGSDVSAVKMDSAGNWTGSFEEYKAARNSGKLK